MVAVTIAMSLNYVFPNNLWIFIFIIFVDVSFVSFYKMVKSVVRHMRNC